MNINKSQLAVAMGLVLALGAAGQASASVYAHSRLLIQNLTIESTNTGGGIGQPGTDITSFSFTLTNTASLNGASAADSSDSCGGTFFSNDCTPGVPAALDTNPSNAPGGTVNRSNNDFTLFGMGMDQYSNSDSVIDDAELAGDASTATRQIAESELQSGTQAAANAEIQSTTGLVFSFTVGGPQTTDLTISFEADPSMQAAINQLSFLNGNAQSNLSVSLTLNNEDTNEQVSWSPQGTAGNTCDSEIAGVTCNELADGEDLNRNLSVSSNPADANYSLGAGFSDFGIEILALTAGSYSLSLNAVTSTQLRQEQPVPLPGTLLLLGAGLVGAGAMRKKAAKA